MTDIRKGSWILKYGKNADVDPGSTPEDVWDVGGAYPWPAAAATTTVNWSFREPVF